MTHSLRLGWLCIAMLVFALAFSVNAEAGKSKSTTSAATLTAPTLLSPAIGATGVTMPATLSWNAVTGAGAYVVQVSPDSTFATGVMTSPPNKSTSSVVPPLKPATQYSWRVCALAPISTPTSTQSGAKKDAAPSDPLANVTWSAVWSFTTATPPAPITLAAPALLTPANNATGVTVPVTVTWNAVTGAGGYAVQVSTDSTFKTNALQPLPATTPSAQLPPLMPNTLYYWRVCALPPLPGATSSTKPVTTTVKKCSQACSNQPTGPSAPPPPLANVTWSTVWSFTTAAAPTLAAPILVSPANNATGVAVPVTLTWDAVTGAGAYAVQVSTDNTFATKVIALPPTTTTTVQLPPLTANTVYYWRVSALPPLPCAPTNAQPGTSSTVKKCGQACDKQPSCPQGPPPGPPQGPPPPPPTMTWSTVWSFTTATSTTTTLAAPILVSPSNSATGVALPVTLTWDAVTGATGYTVEVSTDSTFATGVTTTQSTTTSLQVTTLSAGTQYYWRVCAVGLSTTTTSSAAKPVATIGVKRCVSACAKGTTPPPPPGQKPPCPPPGSKPPCPPPPGPPPSPTTGTTSTTTTDTTGPWSAVWSFTTATTTPVTPVTLAAPLLESPDDGAIGQLAQPTLTWDSVTNASAYQIQISTDNTFATCTTLISAKTSVQTAVLTANTLYYWRVYALDDAGVAGAWSEIWSFTTS